MYLNFHHHPLDACAMRAYLEDSRHQLTHSSEYILLQVHMDRARLVSDLTSRNPKTSVFNRVDEQTVALHTGGLHNCEHQEFYSHVAYRIRVPSPYRGMGDIRAMFLGRTVFNTFHLLYSFGLDKRGLSYLNARESTIQSLVTFYEYLLFFYIAMQSGSTALFKMRHHHLLATSKFGFQPCHFDEQTHSNVCEYIAVYLQDGSETDIAIVNHFVDLRDKRLEREEEERNAIKEEASSSD